MSNPDLEKALDGLMDATEYCDDVGLHELAEEIADCYQELGKESPKEHWDVFPPEELSEVLAEATDTTPEEIERGVKELDFSGPEEALEKTSAEELCSLGGIEYVWPGGVISVDERLLEENGLEWTVRCKDCDEPMGATMAETEDDGLGPAYACVNCGWVDRI